MPTPQNMIIVSVINQKGGVGKTTTSINLAAGLALKGKSVLLIDFDPQAHSTIGLGIEPENFKIAINDILISKKNINDAVMESKVPGLFIIPSHIRLDRTEQQLTPELFRETFLSKVIQKIDKKFDFIVIDCRPTLGTLTINALYVCNFVIIPCDVGRYALEGFSDLMETLDNVKDSTVWDKQKYVRILITKYDSRNKLSNGWVLQQLKPYKKMIFKTVIRRNEALNQAHMAQESVFTYKKDSSGAEDYRQLANDFLKLCRSLKIN
ncbi:MAG: ParA family protein [Proteobacteria bacterium]|nr:ParA family protein [Pseudomonadota bacterium]